MADEDTIEACAKETGSCVYWIEERPTKIDAVSAALDNRRTDMDFRELEVNEREWEVEEAEQNIAAREVSPSFLPTSQRTQLLKHPLCRSQLLLTKCCLRLVINPLPATSTKSLILEP